MARHPRLPRFRTVQSGAFERPEESVARAEKRGWEEKNAEEHRRHSRRNPFERALGNRKPWR
jgi:hypothetical protein